MELLKEITEHFDGDVYIPMTLVYEDSFQKIQKPLEECGIAIKHILLESSKCFFKCEQITIDWEIGLIESTKSNGSKRRCYTKEQIEKIRYILTLRSIGLSIKAIQECLNGDKSIKDIVNLHRAQIEASIYDKLNEVHLLNTISGLGDFIGLGDTTQDTVTNEMYDIYYQVLIFKKMKIQLKLVYNDKMIVGLWMNYIGG